MTLSFGTNEKLVIWGNKKMPKYHTDKVVKLQGKEYVLFEGLLEVAQNECKLKSIVPTIIQLPSKDDPACIFQATVTTEDGKLFTATGDASPINVNKMIAVHLIRMAETRAVARALRFLTGFGTAFEELGDMSMNVQPQSTPVKSQYQKPQTKILSEHEAEFIDIERGNKSESRQNEEVSANNPFSVLTGSKPKPVSEEEIKELFGDIIQEVDLCSNDQLKQLNNAAKVAGWKREIIGELYKEVGSLVGYKIDKFADIHSDDVERILKWIGSNKAS